MTAPEPITATALRHATDLANAWGSVEHAHVTLSVIGVVPRPGYGHGHGTLPPTHFHSVESVALRVLGHAVDAAGDDDIREVMEEVVAAAMPDEKEAP